MQSARNALTRRRVLYALGGSGGALGLSLMISAVVAPKMDPSLLKKENRGDAHDDNPELFEKAGTFLLFYPLLSNTIFLVFMASFGFRCGVPSGLGLFLKFYSQL